jgi:hypothetical protein
MAREGFERCRHGVIHRDYPPLIIFGVRERDCAAAEIDICPSQAEDFRAPHPGVHRKVDNWAEI